MCTLSIHTLYVCRYASLYCVRTYITIYAYSLYMCCEYIHTIAMRITTFLHTQGSIARYTHLEIRLSSPSLHVFSNKCMYRAVAAVVVMMVVLCCLRQKISLLSKYRHTFVCTFASFRIVHFTLYTLTCGMCARYVTKEELVWSAWCVRTCL